MKRVAVVGAGVAGAAAALAARREGADVTMFSAGPGASALTSGAASGELSREALRVSEALGVWRFDEAHRVIATRSGALRRVRGADASLLDLSRLAGMRVGVASLPRPGWDGASVARALAATPLAATLGLAFSVVEVELLRESHETRLPEPDFAALADGPDRLAWMAHRIAKAAGREGVDALLVGPWLGTREPMAEALSALAKLPVGEVASLPGEAAGLRLSRAVSRALEGFHARRGRVTVGEDASVEGEAFDAVVIAAGGVTAGGIELVRSDPTRVGGPAPHLVSTVLPSALVAWSVDSAAQTDAALPGLAWGNDAVLPAAGLVTEGLRVMTSARKGLGSVYACGDARWGGDGTVLGAATEGTRAGLLAAR